MPFDGAGVFSPPAADFPAITLTIVNSTKYNSVITDISSGLSNCVTRDGQSAWTGNLPAGGFKITNMNSGVLRGDSVRVAEVQDGTYLYGGIAGGTANALTFTPSPSIPAYATGQRFVFKTGASPNTGAATLAVSGLIAKAIQLDGAALTAGVLEANKWYEAFYDGTQFQLSRYSVSGFSTGDAKLTLKTAADPGWVMANDGTIGSTASTATTRANDDTLALYTLIWTNTDNAQCAVSGGKGASAAADFAANKTIALPKSLGRALAVAGTGAGLTARVLALAMGAEDAVVVAHTHTGTTGGISANHTHDSHSHLNNSKGNDSSDSGGSVVGGSTGTVSSDHSHAFTTNSTGVAATGANIPPTLFLNAMIKL